MSTKLTLTIDETIIEQAKKYAKRKEKSLSNIIENYLKTLIKENTNSETELSPIVKSLKSTFTTTADFDYKKELTKKLSDKYL
jgi:predicted HAD superfamily phosphohydrolase YqeG